MKVKVKYEETVAREATINVDDQELLDYINQGLDEEEQGASLSDVSPDQIHDYLKDFLEEGSELEWAQAPDLDPFAEVYDKNLLEVEVQ